MQTSPRIQHTTPPLPQMDCTITAMDRIEPSPTSTTMNLQVGVRRRGSQLVDYRSRKACIAEELKPQRMSLPCLPTKGIYHVDDDARARRATMVDYVPSTITTTTTTFRNQGGHTTAQEEKEESSELSLSLSPEEEEFTTYGEDAEVFFSIKVATPGKLIRRRSTRTKGLSSSAHYNDKRSSSPSIATTQNLAPLHNSANSFFSAFDESVNITLDLLSLSPTLMLNADTTTTPEDTTSSPPVPTTEQTLPQPETHKHFPQHRQESTRSMPLSELVPTSTKRTSSKTAQNSSSEACLLPSNHQSFLHTSGELSTDYMPTSLKHPPTSLQPPRRSRRPTKPGFVADQRRQRKSMMNWLANQHASRHLVVKRNKKTTADAALEVDVDAPPILVVHTEDTPPIAFVKVIYLPEIDTPAPVDTGNCSSVNGPAA